MREFLWRIIARIMARPAISAWLIERSTRNPYTSITSRDGSEVYMRRGWLFNPYTKDENDNAGPPRWSWLPSIRVHHIMRADDDQHLHDHPWNARTIVLRGWYSEERPFNDHEIWVPARSRRFGERWVNGEYLPREVMIRQEGYTGRVLFESYHRIAEVSPGGVCTLWFTWRYRGTWGFLVGGKKVPYREYLAEKPRT